MNGEKGDIHAELSNIGCNFLKFHLQGSSLNFLLKFAHDLAYATILSNDDTDEPAFASSNLGT